MFDSSYILQFVIFNVKTIKKRRLQEIVKDDKIEIKVVYEVHEIMSVFLLWVLLSKWRLVACLAFTYACKCIMLKARQTESAKRAVAKR